MPLSYFKKIYKILFMVESNCLKLNVFKHTWQGVWTQSEVNVGHGGPGDPSCGHNQTNLKGHGLGCGLEHTAKP